MLGGLVGEYQAKITDENGEVSYEKKYGLKSLIVCTDMTENIHIFCFIRYTVFNYGFYLEAV